MPDTGQALSCVTIAHICVPGDRPEVLRALLASAHNELRHAGVSFMNIGLDTRDPLSSATDGFFAQPTDVNAYVTTLAIWSSFRAARPRHRYTTRSLSSDGEALVCGLRCRAEMVGHRRLARARRAGDAQRIPCRQQARCVGVGRGQRVSAGAGADRVAVPRRVSNVRSGCHSRWCFAGERERPGNTGAASGAPVAAALRNANAFVPRCARQRVRRCAWRDLHGRRSQYPGRRPDDLVPLLRSATGSLEAGLRPRFPAISFRWTGEIPLNYDLRKASASDARRAERRVLPLTAILLVVAFGAVAAAVLPVFAGALSISLALGAAVILTRFFPLSLLLQNVVAMLGLGLGIDYALLVVGRFREALLEGMSSRAAAQEAGRRAGHTIMLSGAVVAIAFTSLLMVPVNEIRSIAVGGLLVIIVTVMLATSLLPAVLSLLGTRINAGSIPWLSLRAASDGWRRWGRFVCAHPVVVLVLASAPLAAIALHAGRLRTDLPRGDWLPRDMESSRGLRTLSSMKTSGIVNAVRVVAHFPRGSTWDSPEGWAALRRGSETLSRDERVARVRSLTDSDRIHHAESPAAGCDATRRDRIHGDSRRPAGAH